MTNKTAPPYDAVLLTAFGGPEKQDDVVPYLKRVTQGRVPEQRLKAVARHYELFDGKSPVKEVTFQQAKALEGTLKDRGTALPVYVGMRHWHPFLSDTLKDMSRDGVTRVFVIIMSLFQSRASWDQYQSDMEKAVALANVELSFVYAPPAYDRPGFVNTMAKHIATCLEQIPSAEREKAPIVFTAHSIPHADPHVEQYAQQVKTSAESIAHKLKHDRWSIAYQSRSGRPQDPWLEPDVNDLLRELEEQGTQKVVVAPIGFVCDNIEVLYDLSTQARETARDLGLDFLLAKTVGIASAFIDTLADMVHDKS